MVNLIAPDHLDQIRRFKGLFSRYQRARDLIVVGAYVPGSDPVLDEAVKLYPRMEKYLQQNFGESARFEESVTGLKALFAADEAGGAG
jgi:flagellum-specific ATP synthase